LSLFAFRCHSFLDLLNIPKALFYLHPRRINFNDLLAVSLVLDSDVANNQGSFSRFALALDGLLRLVLSSVAVLFFSFFPFYEAFVSL
jgi:hypothetical protein